MTKEGLDYISNFIRGIFRDDNIISIMKQNYASEIDQEDIDRLDLSGVDNKYFCEFSGSEIISAYDPFLHVIKDMVEKFHIDINALIDEADIYSLQKNSFSSYLATGVVTREEDLLLGERDYERKRFVNGIVNLLMNLSEKYGIFILINNGNYMCDSTLSVLEELKERKSTFFKVMVITDEMSNIKNYVEDRYSRFIQQSDIEGLVVDWAFGEFGREKKNDRTISFKYSIDELAKIRNMFYTLAIEQADYYLGMIYQKIEFEKVIISMNYRMELLSLYTITSIFRENYSYALVLCDKFNEFNAKEKENYKRYKYFYYQALAEMYISNKDSAREKADKCAAAARVLDDDFYIFQAALIKNMSGISGWKNVWTGDIRKELPFELVEQCKKYGYVNHMAHILVYSFNNDYERYAGPEDIEEKIPQVIQGIEIAKKIGNDIFLLEAFKKCIMMASCNGHFDMASYFYMKSVEIVKKNKDEFEEANIYNGLGYTSCTADRFELANKYYNKALKIFYHQKSEDYIVETLYNMGINAILGADYAHALEYLTTVSNILRILKKDSLRVCNISKVFGLISVAAFKLGNYYVAQLYNNKERQFLGDIIYRSIEEFETYMWSDDMFLYFYVKALMEEAAGKYEEALGFYEESEVFMIKSNGSKFFNFAFYAEDKAKLLKKMNRVDEALVLLKEARKYFDDLGSPIRLKMFDDYINKGTWTPPELVLNLTSVTIGQVVDYIKLKSIENEAVSTRGHLRFFGTFQELVNNEYNSVRHMMEKLITTFRVNFNLDNILFVSCENGKGKIEFSDLEYRISDENLEELVSYFKTNTTGFSLSKFSNNYNDYQTILNIFERSKIFSIIGAPIYRFDKLHSIFITFVKVPDTWNAPIGRGALDDDERSMYMIVFRQIIDALEKFKLNEELKHQAITDELTGLYNRKGYYRILDRYVDYANRTGKNVDITIMYMDLDHFKYYNDTFGHDLGDALLIRFAEIFKEACGSNGDVIRFGGDEFIILLNTINDSVINSTVESIYSQIEKEKGFRKFVEKYKKEGVEIPDACMATCSIGIETGHGIASTEEYSILQKHADIALYYGKNTTRGVATRYCDIESVTES